MFKASALSLFSLVLLGCASQPLPQASLPLPQRAKPLEAMQVPSAVRVFEHCRLPGFAALSLEQQADQLRKCIEQLGPAYRDLLKRHAATVDWIESSTCTASSPLRRPP